MFLESHMLRFLNKIMCFIFKTFEHVFFLLLQNNRVAFTLPINFEASSVSTNAATTDVAISGDDSKVHIYQLNGTTLTPKTEIVHLGPVTDCAYSPDNKYLVACDANRKVILYSVDEYKVSTCSFKQCFTVVTIVQNKI